MSSVRANWGSVTVALCALVVVMAQAHVVVDERHGGGMQKEYSARNAWMGLHLSKASYCPEERLLNWTCGATCEELATFELYHTYTNASYDTFGYSGVDHTRQRIVFAFRGSRSVANWIANLEFWPLQYPNPACPGNCTVHRGFYYSYMSLREDVVRDADALHAKYPAYSFFVTGHSLGGAIAILCALDLSTLERVRADPAGGTGGPGALRLVPLDIYTFGVPRVGGLDFTLWSTSVLAYAKQFRLTHAQDPVPHLPPRSWSYVHVPQELWFPNGTEKMYYCLDNATAEDPNCSNSVWSTVVSDHLFYLDVCTRCECTPADLEEIFSYTLDPDVEQLLREEHIASHTEGGAV